MRAPDHHSDSDIFWAFRLLDTAVEREDISAGALAEALRERGLWPGMMPKRQFRLHPGAVAVLAATVAWPVAAIAEEHKGTPADGHTAATRSADTSAPAINLSVSDASSSRPIAGVRVLDASGKLVGTTGSDGRLAVPMGRLAADELKLEAQGYKAATKRRLAKVKPGTTVFIGLVQEPRHEGEHVPEAAKSHEHKASEAPPATALKVHFPSPTPAARKVARRPKAATHEVVDQKAIVTRTHAATIPHDAGTSEAPHAVHVTEAPVAAENHGSETAPQAPPAGRETRTAHPGTTTAHPAQGDRITVRAGDTLWGLAARHLGRGTSWRAIWQANRDALPSPHKLRIGQVLYLSATSGHKSTGIRVRRGDSLWKLSKRHLGAGHRWKVLYRANRDRIAHPAKIYPGQRLVLP
ncbi:MAG: LysM peptidoglycan-binding domain-containing protein [Candidatus Sericytochromatia bacterium]|nr:LysM peptidoglycan-binding domain-containing protein [Candidatus Sericytochromatia bacterium]